MQQALRALDVSSYAMTGNSFTSVPNAKLFFYEEQPELVAEWVTAFVAGSV